MQTLIGRRIHYVLITLSNHFALLINFQMKRLCPFYSNGLFQEILEL